MIENNLFYIEPLKNVLFIGYNPRLENLYKINEKLGINSSLITSEDTSKLITLEHNIFNSADKSLYEYIEKNFTISETLFISLGSRIIFDKKFISFLNGNLINFHGTRLPYDAGGGGFSWHIMRQDRIDCQTAHIVDEGIDTGSIIDFKTSIFPKSCSIPCDFEDHRLNQLEKFYSELIENLNDGKKYNLKEQPSYLGRYNPRLDTNTNAYIDWNCGDFDLYNFINAFDDPYNGAMTFVDRGEHGVVRLKSVHFHGGDTSNHPFMSGLISRHDGDWIVVSLKGKYSLIVEKVLDANGNNIINELKAGDRFFTTPEVINSARAKKIIYTSKGIKS